MYSIRQKRESEIIEAAKRVFLKKGYTIATMEDIVAETNLSKGGVYHYFKNKTDVCIRLIDSVTSKKLDLNDKIRKSDDDSDIIEKVYEYFLEILVNDSKDVKLASIIYIDTRNDTKLQKRFHEHFVGRDFKNISEYVYSNVNVINTDLFERKLKYFLEIFHALLYYKYIENINYSEFENDIKEMFSSIFQDIIVKKK